MKTAKAKHGTEFITEPLTPDEIRAAQTDSRGIEFSKGLKVNIGLDIDEIIKGEEVFNQMVSEAVTGNGFCLKEVEFKPVDVLDFLVILEVIGFVEEQDLEDVLEA